MKNRTKLRWGILGCANIAESSIMPAIRDSSSGMIEAVASRELGKSQRLAKKFRVGKAYSSYEELLSDPAVDAVYVPLPNHLHKEWVILAAKAGKHILCEKPMALHASEAAEMVEAASKAGVVLAEAFMYRHHPLMWEIKERIMSGDLGSLRVIRGVFTCNSAEDVSNIRFRREYGGGVLYDLGGYPLSAARFFTGAEPQAVTVHAQYSHEHDGVEMTAAGLLEFPGGVSCCFDVSLWAEERRCLEIVGSKGRIEIPFAFSGKAQSGYRWIRNGVELVFEEEHHNSYLLQIEDFGASVLQGRSPKFSALDAVNNAMLLEACHTAAEQQQRVVMPVQGKGLG
ncbi:Gfo/Idh/MocA family protein [Paenibacillus sp. CAA11]|uniref:Gfo/Idh/MocA family protein n=1 Tax=Paenibacillus sp. CAA11 TaxID=1532905 RepID=UPI001F2B73F0|nr:Gfo/Idh/MocA family oxidoreductase [Paenibacillus sp. CAA11]